MAGFDRDNDSECRSLADAESLLRKDTRPAVAGWQASANAPRWALAVAGVVVATALCAGLRGSRLGFANFSAQVNKQEVATPVSGQPTAESPPTAESGVPMNSGSQNAFDELDPDRDGFVIEDGPDGSPLKKVDYETFKADVQVEKQKVAQENEAEAKVRDGEVEGFDSVTYWRHMAGAGFADAEGLDAGEMVLKAVVVPLDPKYAAVVELYTYGAPATTFAGLFNAQVEGGCIPGMRVVTQSPVWMPLEQTLMLQSDLVPSLLDFAYKHALMDFMPASTVNVRTDPIRQCEYYREHPHRLKDTPKWDNMWWINGHMVYPSVMKSHLDKYPSSPYNPISANDLNLLGGATVARRLQSVKSYNDMTAQEKLERATLMSRLTFANYGPPLQASVVEASMGWVLVGAANGATDQGAASGLIGVGGSERDQTGSAGHTMYSTVSTFSDGFGDHMMLFQHRDTLECVLVFEGSGLDDLKDWLANLNCWATEFCGFGPTHKGFRAKVLRMVGGIDYRQVIHRRLSSCSAVIVGGHSLGGAQAELFTACANYPRQQNEPGYLDHRLIRIPKGEPKRLEHFLSDHAQGSYLRNKGNNLCLDVRGTATTVYRGQVIMYYCELPDSNFGKDQKWKFTPEGFIVSELSGKCMDGNATTKDTRVAQWTCEFGLPDTDQQWDLTPEGFLRNRKSGMCVDDEMQMYDCPFTDQVWQLTDAGLLVNKLSGMCMNVKPVPPGLAPGEGSLLYLGTCEYNKPGTWHIWELDGFRLKSKFNGLCVTEKLNEGVVRAPQVMLGPCGEGNADKFGQFTDRWQLTPEGVLKNEYTDRCIDVPGTPGTAMWTILTVNRCEDKGVATSGLWRKDPRGFIVNAGMHIKRQSKCIEIFAEEWNTTQENADGAELFLDFCKLNSDQKWDVRSDGKIKNVIGGEKCLSIMTDSVLTTVSSPKFHWIDNCAEVDDPAMFLTFKWDLNPSGKLVNRFSHRCMTYITQQERGSSPLLGLGMDELEVVAEWCEDARHGSEWSLREDGSVLHAETGKCLDIGMADISGKIPVILRPCSAASPGQRWQLIDLGVLMNEQVGKCVEQVYDPNSLTQVNGSHVFKQELGVMAMPCPANRQMLWELLPSGQIRNQATNKCLDAPHPGQLLPSGSALPAYTLTQWDCDATIPTQIFEAIPARIVSIEMI